MRMTEGVCLLIQDPAGKYLFQMRDNQPENAYKLIWDFFGGGVDPGETPVQCARREFQEELGVAASEADFVLETTLHDAPGIQHVVRYCKPLSWGEFIVLEGAGAGFFSLKDAAVLPFAENERIVLNAALALEKSA